jgi:hypothetical protein
MKNLDKMWKALKKHQPMADQLGYGPEWKRMCDERTSAAAWGASVVAYRAAASAADDDVHEAAFAAGAAAYAVYAVKAIS